MLHLQLRTPATRTQKNSSSQIHHQITNHRLAIDHRTLPRSNLIIQRIQQFCQQRLRQSSARLDLQPVYQAWAVKMKSQPTHAQNGRRPSRGIGPSSLHPSSLITSSTSQQRLGEIPTATKVSVPLKINDDVFMQGSEDNFTHDDIFNVSRTSYALPIKTPNTSRIKNAAKIKNIMRLRHIVFFITLAKSQTQQISADQHQNFLPILLRWWVLNVNLLVAKQTNKLCNNQLRMSDEVYW